MRYQIDPRSQNKLSILGFGCMRFPRTPIGIIDFKKSESLVLRAIELGINYFDTAHVYMGSEQALGQILFKNQAREKIFLATKLPLMKCKVYEDFDRLLMEQLDRLHTSYMDYYLMHNLSTLSNWNELCELGVERWIAEKKQSGQIRQVGFSFHGALDQFMAVLDAYDWDFCQIQYNYVNINYQAGRAGLLRAAEKGIPTMIMEPLLGGKLAKGLPKKALECFRSADSNISHAAWALRWLWNQPEVSLVLSGMNGMSQLEENCRIAEGGATGVLSPAEERVYEDVARIFAETDKVPCTGCHYCMPCPKGVNIPGCFSAYNLSYSVGMITAFQLYATTTGAFAGKGDSSPGHCVRCGLCEQQCPQHIPIMDGLEAVEKRMEPLAFRLAKNLVRKLRKA